MKMKCVLLLSALVFTVTCRPDPDYLDGPEDQASVVKPYLSKGSTKGADNLAYSDVELQDENAPNEIGLRGSNTKKILQKMFKSMENGLHSKLDTLEAAITNIAGNNTERLDTLEAAITNIADNNTERLDTLEAAITNIAGNNTERLDTLEATITNIAGNNTERLDTLEANQDRKLESIRAAIANLALNADCSAPWTDLGNSGCFLFNTSSVNWNTARSACRSEGGSDLAVIPDSSDRQAVVDHITSGDWFIGGNDRSGSWKWNNGQAVNSTSWESSQPNGDSGDDTCLYLLQVQKYGIELWDAACTSSRGFICQK